MDMKLAVLAAVLAAAPLTGLSQTQSPGAHDKAWWQAVIADDFTPPEDRPLSSLTQELSDYLASADPELRDDIAYSLLTQWMYVKRIMPPELRTALIGDWSVNLTYRIGEQGTESVFRRSFSALMLSVAAALDNEAPYLDKASFDRLLHAGLAYLRDERDTRGFEAPNGWMHSVAHTADLLKLLGRSRHLGKTQQSVILTAITDKLTRLDHVLVHGEDERLARAVLSIIARPDFDMQAFHTFLSALEQARSEGLPTPAALAANQNCKNLAVSLYAVLNTDARELETLHEARGKTLELLRTMM
ncbi:MAG: DUF2785 domain-containing protein [Woeseia sp.]